MRLTLTIIITKALRYILKRFGRGSSMPGKVALKLYPNVLKDIKLPKYIIAVTGSNGKTTTTSLIYYLLQNAGLNVGLGYNQVSVVNGEIAFISLDN